jgi:hypothetical protein
MRNESLAFCVACLVICGCRDSQDEYVPYVPIVRTIGGELVEDPQILSPAHLDALKVVLRNYNEPFVVRADGVYIPRSLRADMDLLANYTDKAEALRDGTWSPLPTWVGPATPTDGQAPRNSECETPNAE